ncbi:NAD(P)/FAD-dependent oxidoreductase [Actinomadura darangshiensis]|uniref:NAD(P)/FAD-dependent oxidoreductase n=1 Tax=Actinomadura darangshiensis TaxID=705336 RepID=A0A4R5BU44_9ACTN|nr:NAD(P)/FAD-dependent oxidoreductase [Actinomadura darangshiensis]TDD89635.1 NAD(P)/FAD-dependent oxidoreductase [Actinomadura darangshiensis]
MGERFDVVIVGARCAGSPLAVLLARAGLKVALVEQARFPRETLSSHLMEADALTFLMRLGVGDPVRATGVRFLTRADVRLEGFEVLAPFPLRFDDPGGAAFLRRNLLDGILADAAADAGADLRMNTKVVDVLWDRGRVSGVRVRHGGVEADLRAPLLVGADGRRSTVAYMCASRKYNVEPGRRSYYFTFFEGADPEYSDRFVFHRWGDRMVWGGPADGGLYLLGVSPEGHEREYFRTETERGLLAHLRGCEPTARALAGARVATRIVGIRNFDGYFRQASGPGWVLAGDAGHFKDPALGRGIGDAFLQVEALAPAIARGLGGTSADLDTALRRWGRWRDAHFEGHYWLAANLGCAGAIPPMIPQTLRRLQDAGELDRFFDLFSRRADYGDVFPLRDLGTATLRLLASPRTRRAPLVRQAASLLLRESGRRWRRRNPALGASDLTPAPAYRMRAGAERAESVSGPPMTAVAGPSDEG